MKGNQWETRERKENKGKPMENERRTCSKNICCLSRYVSVSYYGFIVSFLLLCLCLCVCLSVRLSARVWEVSLYLSRSLCVSVSLFLLVSVLFVSLICFLLSVCPVERQMCACIFVCVFLFSFFGSLYLPPFVSVFPTGGLEPFEDEWAFLHNFWKAFCLHLAFNLKRLASCLHLAFVQRASFTAKHHLISCRKGFQKPQQKLPNVTSETGRKWRFSLHFPATAAAAPTASALAAAATRKTAAGQQNTMARNNGEARKWRAKTA